jgi:hypothetical protein
MPTPAPALAKVTLQSTIAKDKNSGDLSPLASNPTFSKNAELQFAQQQDAAEKSAIAADKAIAVTEANNDLIYSVGLFSSAVGALKEISMRFPETSVPITEALKQTKIAMGLVHREIDYLAPAAPLYSPAPAVLPAPISPRPTPADVVYGSPYSGPVEKV